ncbi:NADPH:quinone oxidoreductase family protein [Cohnella laeviribosi]|uniref:NADPH:quinone oxidoreductase family protein n=1 Tax=Cohnella laeviribosi TaxID=380174 RepID=UPI0003774F2D|nr:acryloyl-CoA reductase [Cohnella laeviribosi]
MQTFRALVVNREKDKVAANIREMTFEELPEGEVTIRVAYSCVNYKDGLAAIPEGRVVKTYPIVPGIDLAGTVVASRDPRFKEGDEVLATGYELGVSRHGGFSQYARVPADWVVPVPEGLTLKEAMAYGTAGFTAALSIHRLEAHGVTPEKGPVLVTGATGGVGSLAVAMLAKIGYEVTASTGKDSEHAYLQKLGAANIVSRSSLSPEKIRPLDRQLWAGAIDPVGGKSLAYILSTTKYGGSVAVSGLAGGAELPTTVHPFILRGVNLLGIDSVYCPMDLRVRLWQRMASDWKPDGLLDEVISEVGLDELPGVLTSVLEGRHRGRTIVRL